MWQFIFGVPRSQPLAGRVSTNVCTDAILVILAQIRAMLNHNTDPDETIPWIQEYPLTLIQFLLYLYHNVPEFKPVCMSAPFLCGLASTLFPYIANTEQVISPVEEYVNISLVRISLPFCLTLSFFQITLLFVHLMLSGVWQANFLLPPRLVDKSLNICCSD